MGHSPHHLSYEPADVTRPARRRRRWIVGLLIAGAVAMLWIAGPGWLVRVQGWYWQRQWMAHEFSPGQVVVKVPDDFYRPTLSSPAAARYLSTYANSDYLIYLHARRTPAGKQRLVAVRFSINISFDDSPFMVIAISEVLIPQWFGYSKWISASPASLFALAMEPTSSGIKGAVSSTNTFTILAGVTDPVDQSHFTFVVQRVGQADVIYDGWLHDNDSVLIEPRLPRPATTLPTR